MNFWDKIGRLHQKPVITPNDPYPGNNAYWYTAVFKILFPEKQINPYLPTTMPFSRHPDVLSVAMSHDELYGVCVLSKEKAKEICEYLKNNHNQFCDLPGFKSKSLLSLNFVRVYKAFKLLNKEEKPRTATIKYPDTWHLAFLQRPEHMWFYKRAAGYTPNLFERLYFIGARIVSIIQLKKEDPNLLLFFSLKYLKQIGNLGIEGQLIQMYLNTVVVDMYEDIDEMLHNYLDPRYVSEHPWITGKETNE